MAKSVLVTYLLWLTGGWFGLHHLYLGRERHAFVWWMTLGGYFGLGWLRDLWRIPSYVKYANCEAEFMQQLKETIRLHRKPPSTTVRSVGQVIVADALGYVVLYALPLEYIPENILPVVAFPVPLAVAIGVHLVGNIGEHQGVFKWPLIGAYLTYPLYFWSTHSVFMTSLVSIYFFRTYSHAWRLQPAVRRHPCRRVSTFAACCLLYALLWTSWLYFNCSLTDNDDTQVKCRDSLRHFFGSPMWQDFKTVVSGLYNQVKHRGFGEVWKLFMEALDPQGEANALKVLNVPATASEETLRMAYRKLSRQWHPDRVKDPVKKQEAQEKFIEIQKAYETLSRLKVRRVMQNKKERENPNSERSEL
ncbi:dnaJ homolog subfamily C member 22-like [Ornithodoros turicata]|uniref:dnaJ homolog subfamily C member 22-like n=1 Tax=Ornithodoros turicata TaxID=34597 RepID=UPI00313A1BB5